MEKAFENNIRILRQMKKMSINDLAKDLDVSMSFLSYLERGYSIPKLDFAYEMADYFGVEIGELFYRSEENPLFSKVMGSN